MHRECPVEDDVGLVVPPPIATVEIEDSVFGHARLRSPRLETGNINQFRC
jgi:hypothetical protein